MLFVPRQMGYDHYCEICATFHAYLLLKVIKCDLENGINITMCMNEEEALYRETRLIPVYGEEATLRKLLNKIELFEINNPYEEESSWLYTMRHMMLPRLRCAESSGGL